MDEFLSFIQYDEAWIDYELNQAQYYYIAPKEMLNGIMNIDNISSAEICIEFPADKIDANYGVVRISPTKEIDGIMTDYDWCDFALSYEDIDALIKLAN